jgi:protein-tyrosine phosphatase
MRAIAAREFPSLEIEFDSAGTADYHVGEPPDRRTVAAASRRGYDLSGLRARQLQPADFDRFDFVIAMDRANLAGLDDRRPRSGSARVGLFLEYAPETEVAEVPDPYYGGVEEFERVLDLCEAAARGMLTHLVNEKGPHACAREPSPELP